MLKMLAVICFNLLTISSFAQQTSQNYGLPNGALIIEIHPIRANRTLILWMLNPVKHPNENPDSDFYTCPDETRGSYYSGVVRVTLLDSITDKIINMLEVKDEDGDSKSPDGIDIPYAIRGGYYYTVPGSDKTKEKKPRIMALKDYNGDGKAQEFALYDKQACQGLATTLIGYSERRDKVIQYPLRLTVKDKGKASGEITYWIDYLFSKNPQTPGNWRYKIDYRGRGGNLDEYHIHYNKQAEEFEAVFTSTKGN